MDARNNIATDLFYKIRSRFTGLKLGEETGQITINPEEARFFDFDYMEGETPVGHVSISLAEPNSMKVYFSHGITENMDGRQKDNWYGFLKELRQFAKRRLLSFDTRDIAKDNLDQRDYEFLSQNAQPKQTEPNMIQKPVGESIMSESTMYGSRTMSYQKLMDTRLIIKHSQAVMDDTQPGARTRNISALFVENQDGERFKYPFIHLAGARAMQRHVANGGVPYDDIGKSIIRMSEEIAALKSFGGYVVRNDLMNSMNNDIVERSSSYLNGLREQIKALSKQSHYEAYRENFQAQDQLEVPQDVVEDLTEKFTVKNFKEDIANVFPVLYRLMKEGSTIGYDDIVAMTQEETTNEDIEIDIEEETNDPFAKFEQWVMGLGEDSAIVSEDPEEQQAAIKELQELVSEHFPAGTDGTNAIESLKGLIEDPQLYKEIKETAKQDPDTCVRGLVLDWLEMNAPEVIEQLDFGDFVKEPEAQETVPAEASDPNHPEYDKADDYDLSPAQRGKGTDKYRLPDTQKHDDRHKRDFQKRAGTYKGESGEQLNVQELAEFITSFYDKESNSFPKGPEGVCTMVGKKFGEQAESVARKFVERMAPQQSTEQNPELAELSRIAELAGVSEGPMWDKVKAMGGKARDAFTNLTDVGAEGMHRRNFEKWIDQQEGLIQHKEELLQYFDDEIESGTESDQAGRKALDTLKSKAHGMNQESAEVSEGPLDVLKKIGQNVGDKVKGAVSSAKTFMHKSAQDAVDEYMKKKYPGKVADTQAKKDAALGLYIVDNGILSRQELDKLKPMLANAGGLFQTCVDLKCDFNMGSVRNPGKLLKDLLYPKGNTEKDADGNVTSFRMAPAESADELTRIKELAKI